METEISNALRAPFEPEFISKLPRVTCAECRKAQGKVCPKHRKVECLTCGNWVTNAHMHLDYVGHADVTNRLLLVDPAWSWEPAAFDAEGLPKIAKSPDGQYVMWIRLSVGGVTRLGVGSVASDAGDLYKQLISDALRNAAMRFGVALDLWSKADRLEAAPIDGHCEGQPGSVADVASAVSEAAGTVVAAAAVPTQASPSWIKLIGVLMAETAVPKGERLDFACKVIGREIQSVRDLTEAEANAIIRQLVADKEALAAAGEPDPVVAARQEEPEPEYHGDDDDGEFEREYHEAAEIHPEPTVEREAATATSPKGAAAPLTAAQGQTIGRMMDELEIGKEMRPRYLSNVLGREVGGVGELSRGEASKVLKQLVADKESLATAARAAEEDFIDF